MPPRSGCSACHLLIACVISLLTVTFSTVAFFGPNSPALQYLSQVTISPSTQLQPPNRAPATTPDGPSISFGIFGSCAQSRSDGARTCTGMAFNPQYNFSVLPPNTPTYVLVDPPIHNKIFGYISFGLWPFLFFLVVLILYNRFSGSMEWVETFFMRTMIFPWIGMIACVISCVNFWSLHLYFDSICYNFNHFVARQGAAGPLLMASRGDALRYGYASCALFCIPWMTILVESMYLADNPGDKSADQLTDNSSSTGSPVFTHSPAPPYSSYHLPGYYSAHNSPGNLSLPEIPPSPNGTYMPGYYPPHNSPRNVPLPETPASQNGTYIPLQDRRWPQVSPSLQNSLRLARYPDGYANEDLSSLKDFNQTLALPPTVITTPATPRTTMSTPGRLPGIPPMTPNVLNNHGLTVPTQSHSPAQSTRLSYGTPRTGASRLVPLPPSPRSTPLRPSPGSTSKSTLIPLPPVTPIPSTSQLPNVDNEAYRADFNGIASN